MNGEVIELAITKEQAQFLKEFVRSISRYEIDFKKDFILTEEHERILSELEEEFEILREEYSNDCVNDFREELEEDEEDEEIGGVYVDITSVIDDTTIEPIIEEFEGNFYLHLLLECDVDIN